MIRSLSSRLGGAVVALVLGTTALAAVGVSTPANAASVTCATKVTLSVGSTSVVYGDYNSLHADVTPVNCSDTYVSSGAGAVYIERSLDGRTWQRVKAGDYPSYVYYSGENATPVSAYYRATYTGGTESTTYEPSTFTPSASAPVHVVVNRSLAGSTIKKHGGKAVARIKVTPGVSGKFVMQVKKGKKWKKVRKVAFRSGRATVKVSYPRHGKTTYRIVVPASGGYPALPVVFWVKRL